MTNTIAISSDHAGIELKAALVAFIEQSGFAALDLGPYNQHSVDYPDYANLLCNDIKHGKAIKGVLICGSGIGMSIAANRHKEIRAALVHNVETATLCRQHNDANVLVLGARFLDEATAIACLKAFLTTEFEGGRHANRVAKLG
jgi:ribose 5-phosphate isomerase B